MLTAMSVATILFRPVAGYLLDNFNRYHVYLVFLALFCLSFPAFIVFPIFAALIVIRLYMGAVYSVCGSATMTLAGDVLPTTKITEGISRFAFTISIGMAVGPFVGIQVQNNMNSQASFMTVFGITVVAFLCVACCRIRYPIFQSFVTGTTPAPQRGVANATYMLSYDVGIGIGSLLMGFMQESIGLSVGFALTAIAYVIGAIIYSIHVEKYYHGLRHSIAAPMEKE